MQRIADLLPTILLTLLLLCLWEIVVAKGNINSALFPAPSGIALALKDIFQHNVPDSGSLLLIHVKATFLRFVLALSIGVISGMFTGLLMGLWNRLHDILQPFIVFLMPIPGIALAPLFVVWIGLGNPTIITVGAIAAFFPVVLKTYMGIRSIDGQLVNAARIMGASPVQVIRSVYLPSAAVFLIVGFKLAMARCWRTVIAVELIAAADAGLGYMIMDASEYLNAPVVYGGIVLMAVIFVVMEKGVVSQIETRTIKKWGMVSR